MKALFVYNLITFRRGLPRLLLIAAAALAANLLIRRPSYGSFAVVLLFSRGVMAGADGAAWERWLLTLPVSRRQLVICSYMTEAAFRLEISLLCAALFLLLGETARVALLSCAAIYCLLLALAGITLYFDFRYGPGGRGKLEGAVILSVLILMFLSLVLLAELSDADTVLPLLIFPVSAAVSVALSLRGSVRAFEERDL